MNSDDLELFHAVVESGGFSAAARLLELPVSNVSRRILQLEERLGTSLFLRTTRVVTPTKQGLLFYQRTKSICFDLKHSIEELSNKKQSVKGAIRVQLLPAATPLIRYFYEFQSKYPDIHIDIVVESQNICLIENQIDLAIKVGDQGDSNLKCRKLTPIILSMVASPKYVAKHGALQSIDDLATHNCLLFRDSDNKVESTWKLTDGEASHSVKVAGNFISNDISLVRRAVLLGQGVALLPKILCRDDIKAGRLFVFSEYQRQYDVWLVFPTTKYQPSCVRLLIDFLASIARMPDKLEMFDPI